MQLLMQLLKQLESKYSWLEFDKSAMSGKFVNVPQRDEIPENINEQLIVELYSK
jgi:small subunit ribosomal protein S4